MSFKDYSQLMPFLSDVFFETGTYHGNTSRAASIIGFPRVITVELLLYLFETAKEKSKNFNNIEFYHGNSPEVMKSILPTVKGKITFWLDAHLGGLNYIRALDPTDPCPLFEELDVIKSLERNDHIILIDDLRTMGKNYPHVTLPGIIDKIKSINSDYQIDFLDGTTVQDILVAKL